MTIIQHPDEITTVVPADWVPGPPQGSWTYEAYAALPDDGKRYEIATGHLITKPMPEIIHQRVSMKVLVCLYQQIDVQNRGEVLAGPIDVSLAEKDLFQPDLLVILNEHLDRVHEKRIIGAPDLVVEVTSPLTWLHDRVNKYNAYAAAGVPEYWFVDPAKKTIEVFVLKDSEYTSLGILHGEQILSSQLLPDLAVSVASFFGRE
jgi:Uma2 family endonuclease